MDWEMKVLGRFPKDPLKRLIKESLNISQADQTMSLNNKVEMAKSNLVQVSFISDHKKDQMEQKAIAKAINKNKRQHTQTLDRRPTSKDITQIDTNHITDTPKPKNKTVKERILAIEEKTPKAQKPIRPMTPQPKTPKRNGTKSIKDYIKSSPNPAVWNRWQKPPNSPAI